MATYLPYPNSAAIPSSDPLALFDAGTVRMVDPIYRDVDNIGPAFSRKPPVAMLGGGNGGVGEAQTFQILRGLNTIRMGISPPFFDGDNPTFVAAAQTSFQQLMAEGGKFLWLYAEISNADGTITVGTNEEKVRSLTTGVLARALETFRKLRVVLEAHPDLMAGSMGIELMNEPAIYNLYKTQMASDPVYGAPGYFEHLMADHCIKIVEELKPWWKGHIYFPLFRYNGSARDLLVKRNGVTALDRMRRSVDASRVLWSSHAYPTWVIGRSDSLVEGNLRTTLAPLGLDRVVITETNVAGTSIADTTPEVPEVPNFFRAMQYWRRRGVGIGYFPVHNTGASSLVTYNPDGTGSLDHMWATAEYMRMWHARGELPPGVSTHAIRVNADHRDLEGIVKGVEVAPSLRIDVRGAPGSSTAVAGHYNVIMGCGQGGDTLTGVAGARSYLAAIAGNNTLESRGTVDVVRGGIGSDTIVANGTHAVLDGGAGPSTITVNSGRAIVYTGSGVCQMVFGATGQTHEIRDLKLGNTILLVGWGGAPVITQSGADVTIAFGSQSILCKSTTVAFVQNCMVA